MAKQITTFDAEAEWDFTWTTDQRRWQTKQFRSLDECRDFAQDRLSENESNPKYMYYARHYCLVDACDLLDSCIPAHRVKLAERCEVA